MLGGQGRVTSQHVLHAAAEEVCCRLDGGMAGGELWAALDRRFGWGGRGHPGSPVSSDHALQLYIVSALHADGRYRVLRRRAMMAGGGGHRGADSHAGPSATPPGAAGTHHAHPYGDLAKVRLIATPTARLCMFGIPLSPSTITPLRRRIIDLVATGRREGMLLPMLRAKVADDMKSSGVAVRSLHSMVSTLVEQGLLTRNVVLMDGQGRDSGSWSNPGMWTRLWVPAFKPAPQVPDTHAVVHEAAWMMRVAVQMPGGLTSAFTLSRVLGWGRSRVCTLLDRLCRTGSDGVRGTRGGDGRAESEGGDAGADSEGDGSDLEEGEGGAPLASRASSVVSSWGGTSKRSTRHTPWLRVCAVPVWDWVGHVAAASSPVPDALVFAGGQEGEEGNAPAQNEGDGAEDEDEGDATSSSDDEGGDDSSDGAGGVRDDDGGGGGGAPSSSPRGDGGGGSAPRCRSKWVYRWEVCLQACPMTVPAAPSPASVDAPTAPVMWDPVTACTLRSTFPGGSWWWCAPPVQPVGRAAAAHSDGGGGGGHGMGVASGVTPITSLSLLQPIAPPWQDPTAPLATLPAAVEMPSDVSCVMELGRMVQLHRLVWHSGARGIRARDLSAVFGGSTKHAGLVHSTVSQWGIYPSVGRVVARTVATALVADRWTAALHAPAYPDHDGRAVHAGLRDWVDDDNNDVAAQQRDWLRWATRFITHPFTPDHDHAIATIMAHYASTPVDAFLTRHPFSPPSSSTTPAAWGAVPARLDRVAATAYMLAVAAGNVPPRATGHRRPISALPHGVTATVEAHAMGSDDAGAAQTAGQGDGAGDTPSRQPGAEMVRLHRAALAWLLHQRGAACFRRIVAFLQAVHGSCSHHRIGPFTPASATSAMPPTSRRVLISPQAIMRTIQLEQGLATCHVMHVGGGSTSNGEHGGGGAGGAVDQDEAVGFEDGDDLIVLAPHVSHHHAAVVEEVRWVRLGIRWRGEAQVAADAQAFIRHQVPGGEHVSVAPAMHVHAISGGGDVVSHVPAPDHPHLALASVSALGAPFALYRDDVEDVGYQLMQRVQYLGCDAGVVIQPVGLLLPAANLDLARFGPHGPPLPQRQGRRMAMARWRWEKRRWYTGCARFARIRLAGWGERLRMEGDGMAAWQSLLLDEIGVMPHAACQVLMRHGHQPCVCDGGEEEMRAMMRGASTLPRWLQDAAADGTGWEADEDENDEEAGPGDALVNGEAGDAEEGGHVPTPPRRARPARMVPLLPPRPPLADRPPLPRIPLSFARDLAMVAPGRRRHVHWSDADLGQLVRVVAMERAGAELVMQSRYQRAMWRYERKLHRASSLAAATPPPQQQQPPATTVSSPTSEGQLVPMEPQAPASHVRVPVLGAAVVRWPAIAQALGVDVGMAVVAYRTRVLANPAQHARLQMELQRARLTLGVSMHKPRETGEGVVRGSHAGDAQGHADAMTPHAVAGASWPPLPMANNWTLSPSAPLAHGGGVAPPVSTAPALRLTPPLWSSTGAVWQAHPAKPSSAAYALPFLASLSRDAMAALDTATASGGAISAATPVAPHARVAQAAVTKLLLVLARVTALHRVQDEGGGSGEEEAGAGGPWDPALHAARAALSNQADQVTCMPLMELLRAQGWCTMRTASHLRKRAATAPSDVTAMTDLQARVETTAAYHASLVGQGWLPLALLVRAWHVLQANPPSMASSASAHTTHAALGSGGWDGVPQRQLDGAESTGMHALIAAAAAAAILPSVTWASSRPTATMQMAPSCPSISYRLPHALVEVDLLAARAYAAGFRLPTNALATALGGVPLAGAKRGRMEGAMGVGLAAGSAAKRVRIATADALAPDGEGGADAATALDEVLDAHVHDAAGDEAGTGVLRVLDGLYVTQVSHAVAAGRPASIVPPPVWHSKGGRVAPKLSAVHGEGAVEGRVTLLAGHTSWHSVRIAVATSRQVGVVCMMPPSAVHAWVSAAGDGGVCVLDGVAWVLAWQDGGGTWMGEHGGLPAPVAAALQQVGRACGTDPLATAAAIRAGLEAACDAVEAGQARVHRVCWHEGQLYLSPHWVSLYTLPPPSPQDDGGGDRGGHGRGTVPPLHVWVDPLTRAPHAGTLCHVLHRIMSLVCGHATVTEAQVLQGAPTIPPGDVRRLLRLLLACRVIRRRHRRAPPSPVALDGTCVTSPPTVSSMLFGGAPWSDGDGVGAAGGGWMDWEEDSDATAAGECDVMLSPWDVVDADWEAWAGGLVVDVSAGEGVIRLLSQLSGDPYPHPAVTTWYEPTATATFHAAALLSGLQAAAGAGAAAGGGAAV